MCGHRAEHFDYCDFTRACNGYEFGRSGILVEYFRCQACDYTFTDFFDDWSSEEFAEFVYNADYVNADPDYLGDRPRRMAEQMSPVFSISKSDLDCLDYGGGMGIFAEAMRSKGISFEVYDPFSQPIHPDRKFDVVTAFEVIEHSPDPVATFDEMLSFLKDDGCIVISQSMQPENFKEIRANWWYVAPRNGHISFFSDTTMHRFCDARGLTYGRNSGYLVFSRTDKATHVQQIKKNLGITNFRTVIYAPRHGFNTGGEWHEVEVLDNRQFRWSSSRRICLGHYRFHPGMNTIEIPVTAMMNEDILKRCTIDLHARRFLAHYQDGKLRATFMNTEHFSTSVWLTTGKPVNPAELGINSDGRYLGFAVPTGE
jgi:2-polyprenyl-6-hydroxyphenyl methylase/3-demethylubiquinone-9 3-methyltransferase